MNSTVPAHLREAASWIPACLVLALLGLAFEATAQEAISEIIVTSERREMPISGQALAITRLDAELIRDVAPVHLHELLTRAPGVWLSRGSGQESLPALRSPVLTGAGSCGAILTLEDGIPTRPAGFCNVNQLFEIDTEQADAIELVRGPGNGLYGSNALHGTVNVLQPVPGAHGAGYAALEAGANDFLRANISLPLSSQERWFASLLATEDGGFRDESGYRQYKGHAKLQSDLLGGNALFALSFTDLDQETAGFIQGYEAYKDPDVNRSNSNPEAYRKASSQRLYAIWDRRVGDYAIDVRPFLRHTDMEFLQHFLPGQPLEENGHTSAGTLMLATRDYSRGALSFGFDIEWADVWLKETQDGPTEGSEFLQETRPAGKHYDYSVTSSSAAVYTRGVVDLDSRWSVNGGLRAEYTHYRYDNHMLDGNTDENGDPCGFGGCLYTRPSDRSDSYTDLAPSLGIVYSPSDDLQWYASLRQGFRAPQMTELYRLQNGQEIADLEPEEIDSAELGLRITKNRWSVDAALFAMKKSNSILRDAEGLNVNGGRSRHEGIELSVTAQFTPSLWLDVDGSYARHEYDFNSVAAQGETFVAGRDVDTAPRWLGGAELNFEPAGRYAFSLQWTTIGEYFLDAENQFTYPGHALWNGRARVDLTKQFSMTARVNNITDIDYADRGDYAFGNYRYFPGRGREFYLEVRYSGTAGPGSP